MRSDRIKLRGCWDNDQIKSFLCETTIPIRLAVHDSKLSPWVVSLWFLYDGGNIWCATNRNAKLTSYLRANSQCGFEIAGDTPPYRGIRGKGKATVLPEHGGEILGRLLERYDVFPESKLAKSLLAKVEDEVAICLAPSSVTSWDFTNRMTDDP